MENRVYRSSSGVLDSPLHRRCIGRRGSGTGPTMIVVAGIHGNEPAGVLAAERVLARIDGEGIEVRGNFIAIAGNLKALAERTRYVDTDLNRAWTARRVAALADPGIDDAEAAEQREVLELIREQVNASNGPVYFLDLHTTSAASCPFVTVGDTLRNREFARSFPLPLILGLEEQVDGALLEYLNNFGLITMGAEAGQHDCDGSVDRAEALLWLALRRAGLVPADPEIERGFAGLLREASRGVPSVVEVRHRHPVQDADEFKMVPGFDNFAPVEQGQVVAHDRRGEVRAPESGLMLLPLYQGKGEDGYFIARPVRPLWLRLSGLIRRHRRDGRGFMHWLPGVRRGAGRVELIVDKHVARWFPLEFFHLLGYRKRREDGDTLVVTRRAFDNEEPGKIRI
jgi:succinylglutamate desuccinylase